MGNCPSSNSISDLWPEVFQPFPDLSLDWLLRSCLIFGPFQPRLLIAELLIKTRKKRCFLKTAAVRKDAGDYHLVYTNTHINGEHMLRHHIDRP